MATWLRYGLLSVVALLALPAIAEPGPTAVDQLKQYRSALPLDKSRQDWPAYLADAERLHAFLNGSPLSVLELARAQMQLGHVDAARSAVEQFLAMGQTHPLLASDLFAPLGGAPAQEQRRNETPIALGHVAVRLSDPGLVTEDIAFDPKTNRFFLSSILEHRIIAVAQGGHAQDFAAAPDGWPALALKIDAGRRRLWATEVAFAGYDGVANKDAGRSAVLEYDLDSGRLLQRLDGPAGAALGDMALTANGEPILADGQGGGVYRLQAERLSRIDHGDFISPQTPAVCPDGRVFVPDYVRGVATLEPSTGKVRWLASEGRYALTGIDGLYCSRDELLATQNGTVPQRVVAFRMNAGRTAIVGETILDRATPLTDPTHGVVVGKAFYYIGNSGWAALDDNGHVRPGAALSGAAIMVVRRP